MLVLVTLVLMFVLMLMTMFLDGNRRTGIRDRARETEQDQQTNGLQFDFHDASSVENPTYHWW